MSNNRPGMSGEGDGLNEWIPAESFAVVDLATPTFSTPRTQTIVEGLLKTEATTRLGPCQVGSKTDRPCPRLAAVEIWGLPFCESCARQQEAYFTIGELTQEEARGLCNEQLVEVLDRMRWKRTGYTAAVEMEKLTVGAPE